MPTTKKPARVVSTIIDLDTQNLTWGKLRDIVAAAQDDNEAPVVFSYDESTDALVGIYADLAI